MHQIGHLTLTDFQRLVKLKLNQNSRWAHVEDRVVEFLGLVCFIGPLLEHDFELRVVVPVEGSVINGQDCMRVLNGHKSRCRNRVDLD